MSKSQGASIHAGSGQGRNYNNGGWQKHRTDLVVINPSTGEKIGGVPVSTSEEINAAVASAKAAFTFWGDGTRWSWVKRAEVVDDWVQLIKLHTDEISGLVTAECGKHINEAKADVIEGIHMLQYCAAMGRMPIGYKIASEISSKEAETYRMPKGVMTVITPWNFPFAIPTWLIGPALVSGNTVVFKPSEATPLTGQYLVELFWKAAAKHNVPTGTLNLLHGEGGVGNALVNHPDTTGQLFTGSSDVGMSIKKIAAGHPEKFAICEMGGKNSLIIDKDANLELAVNAAILSAYKTTHQRCVSADLLIVDKEIHSKFVSLFLETTKRVRFGDPTDPEVFAGPLISREAQVKFEEHAYRVRHENTDVLLEGSVIPSRGNFVSPYVFGMEYRPDTFALREEAFTPIVMIVPSDHFDHALHIANDTPYGLSMALVTNDYKKMREFKLWGKAGLKYINLPTIGAEVHLPFGGLKRSGTGMPSAAWLFNYMTHDTAFTVNYADEIRLAQGLSSKI